MDYTTNNDEYPDKEVRLLFQYPRLDRRVENLPRRRSLAEDRQFQYPRLDRRVENFTAGKTGSGKTYLVSVSTTGSKGRKQRCDQGPA